MFFFPMLLYFYSFLWYVILIYIPTYGAGPIVFGGKMTHKTWFGSTLATPKVEGRASSRTHLKVLRCPHADPNRIDYVFLPMSVPGPVPNNKKRRGDPRKLPFVIVGFNFLVHPKVPKR